jgi:hypothetical protein
LDDLARIAQLAQAAPPFAVATGALAEQPGFADALRGYSADLARLYEGKTMLIKLMTTPARLSTIALLMALHAHRNPEDPTSGATIGRIRTLASLGSVASGGRVSALLGSFVARGYASSVGVAGDRRLRRLEPAPPLLAHLETWSGIYLDVLDRLYPDARYRALADADPRFTWAWQRHWLLRTIQLGGRESFDPAIRRFVTYDGGQQLLLALVGEAQADGSAALPYSLGPRRFGVSRQHVRNFITDLAAAGHLSIEADGGHRLRLNPDFVTRFRRQTAMLLERYAQISDRAAADVA